MVHVSKNEECFHNICLRSFRCLSGIVGSIVSIIKKKKFKNLLHSQSNMGHIVSMELALAVASFRSYRSWDRLIASILFGILIFNIIPNQVKCEF